MPVFGQFDPVRPQLADHPSPENLIQIRDDHFHEKRDVVAHNTGQEPDHRSRVIRMEGQLGGQPEPLSEPGRRGDHRRDRCEREVLGMWLGPYDDDAFQACGLGFAHGALDPGVQVRSSTQAGEEQQSDIRAKIKKLRIRIEEESLPLVEGSFEDVREHRPMKEGETH